MAKKVTARERRRRRAEDNRAREAEQVKAEQVKAERSKLYIARDPLQDRRASVRGGFAHDGCVNGAPLRYYGDRKLYTGMVRCISTTREITHNANWAAWHKS